MATKRKKRYPKSPRSRRADRYAFVIEFHEPDLARARQIAKADNRSLAWIVRRALHWWLETPDAVTMAVPLEERLRHGQPTAASTPVKAAS